MGAKPDIFINHEWFSKVLMSMGEAVIATDKKGVVTSMNKVAEELTGWSLPESTGKPIDDIFDAINEDTHLPIENPINKALKENRILLLANHTILIKKDKTQRYIVDSAMPVHNDNLEIVGGALIFRDVTELSISKKKLEESNGLLKGIMENTGLIISIKDLEGNYLLINRQKEKVYNIQASELIGKNPAEHLTNGQAAESKRTDNQAVQEQRLIEYEQIIKHSDGTSHNYHTKKFPLYNSEKNIYAVCELSTDISLNKKNSEEKENPAIHKVVLESEMPDDVFTKNMPNIFFSLDDSFRYISFNKACENFTGKKANQVIGKTMKEIFPIGKPMFFTECREVLKIGRAKNFISTFTIDNNTVTYIVNIYPTEKGVSVLMTDLPVQKKSEMQKLEMIDFLEKKNRGLREFASVILHDLSVPIAKASELMSLYGIDPEFKINNRTIQENVASEITRLNKVVKKLKVSTSFRNAEKKKKYIVFETELMLIKQVLNNEIISSKAIITADFKNQEGIVTVKSNLYNIMYHLLSNSIKYRSLQVPLHIHLQTQQENGFICLSVKDNGRGIDMEKNGINLFALYNKFDGKKIEGKGMGLNLVKTQVELLGGKVEVESKENLGSTFKIFLPNNNHHATN